MGSKERINPSRLSTFERCQFLYYVKYELNKVPVTRLPAHMMLGTLFHAGSEAYDRKKWLDGDEAWPAAIRRAVSDLRTSPAYDPRDSALIDQLKGEAHLMMTGGSYMDFRGNETEVEWSHKGGYLEWRTQVQRNRGWETVSLEKRYGIDLGRGIAAPKPDGVIRESGELWVIERKTTQQEGAEFEKRFRVDLQTTLEVMAVEAATGEKVAGVYLLPVKYTRKKSKLWDSDFPQPLHRVTFTEPRPVPKSQAVRSQMELGFDQMLEEIEEKRINKRWLQNHKSCMMGRWPCDLYDLCWGKASIADFIDRPEDDVSEALVRLGERMDV